MSGVLVEDRPDVRARLITFNRPSTLNTLTLEDLRDARDAVLEACADGRNVLFAGTGDRAFSAGMNLDVFAEIVEDPALAQHHLGAVRDLLHAVRTAEVVTLAAIDGHCLGAAFELALACDFRLARTGSKLGLPEINLGLPCAFESAILAQFVGLSLAKDLILTGRLITADELAVFHVCTVYEDSDALTRATWRRLASFAEISAVGIASQKRLFEAWQNAPLARLEETSLDELARVFADDDTRQRVRAYTDRLRNPERIR